MKEICNLGDETQGHRQRLQKRFLKGGLHGFLDYEVVELLLTLGTPRRDCKRLAKQAMGKFKVLRRVLEASEDELQEIKGLGPKNIFGIRLVQEVSRRFLKEKMMSRPVCHSSREVFDYLYHSLRDAQKEKFKAIFLDAKNRIIEEETFFEGTVDTSAVYPREILKKPSSTMLLLSFLSTIIPRAIPSLPKVTGKSPKSLFLQPAPCSLRCWIISSSAITSISVLPIGG